MRRRDRGDERAWRSLLDLCGRLANRDAKWHKIDISFPRLIGHLQKCQGADPAMECLPIDYRSRHYFARFPAEPSLTGKKLGQQLVLKTAQRLSGQDLFP